ISPDGGTVKLADGGVQLGFPAGAVAENTMIQIVPTTGLVPPAGELLASPLFELSAFDGNGAVTSFSQPITITLAVTSSIPASAIAFWDGSGWQQLPGPFTVDSLANMITGTTSHFTVYAALAREPTATPTPAPSATPIGT